MKPKILYLSFAALIITIVIIIFISRESVKIQPVSQKVKPQRPVSDYTEQSPSTSGSIPGITRIKPEPKKPSLPQENPIPDTEETMDESRQAARTAPSQSTGPTNIETESDDFKDEPPTPGITKIDRYPTEQEKQEMNERGIIMY
ncbi:MAG: hypothetical protein A2166_02935 [Omnitrophica WOR_2 bacterium RBG_13_41_10]|nr:MAG: hypothetical protein A2166_02935 [Omnitrophica WOR_2 bacterium RBG_13_41_10]